MSQYRIKVDPDLCIGAASCVTISPETFQLNEENKAYVLDHGTEPTERTYERVVEMDDSEKEQLIMAAQSCPTLAIFIYDESGTQIFPEV
ncbi:MAG: 4Fe-4S ferredoxin [Candidatus Uhrbacteria bacterium GW2011_GWF2_41_16]|uniref:Ferredoxin n=2 Tax=Candidatus Uhriibacteriota TaxID=1752732 RepID=A0A0G0V9Y5_9BACT|nr:MAG: 4Fe-4S ferredoxin [Candidatus Uhrbacteria bacterium GW2011_GWC2_41_11]KKR97734.1 MAG: 4Fe-4S ferredoxin [Candidatus Uhrbacteria bacterium GW2011_GWF2_41_16]